VWGKAVDDRKRKTAIALFLFLFTPIPTWAQTTSYSDLRNAGRTDSDAGRFASAEKFLRNALDAATAAEDREMTAAIFNDLGDAYVGEERLSEAEMAYGRSLAILRGMPGKDFETALAFRNLGAVYSQQYRFGEALKALDQASKLLMGEAARQKSDGLAAEILNSKGIVFLREKRLGKALYLFQHAVRVRSAAGMGGGLDDAHTLNNIGIVYFEQRRYRQAEQPVLDSLNITTRILGPSHTDVALILATLGEIYTQTSRYAEALDQYQRSLAIFRAVVPPQNGRVAGTLQLVSWTYLKWGDRAGAETALAEGVELARHLNAADDPGIPQMFESYADLLEKLRKTDQAREVRAEARRIRAAALLTVHAPVDR